MMRSFETSVYVSRRQALKAQLGAGQVILLGNKESSVNFKDNWYHFRQDSTMLYYTGISTPNVHLVIDIDQDKEMLFGDELTIDDIIWTGPLPSLQDQADQAGIAKVQPLSSLTQVVRSEAMYLPPYRPEHNLLLHHLLGIELNALNNGASTELIKSVIGQRNYKEEREVREMEKAVRYSYDMHRAVMTMNHNGKFEYDLVAEASAVAYRHHSTFSYPAILTKRGEVLHNHDHHGLLNDGDMVLYDGGCESPLHYAGDITRTFPIGGQWSSLQREIYDIVHQAYNDSVAALKPGIPFKDVHLIACRAIASGLKDIGWMKGDIDDAVNEGAHTMFFQCGLGHMIGLDVHDMESLGEPLVGYSDDIKKSSDFGLKSLRLGRKLEKGFVLTIEPGIYIIPSLISLRKSQGLYMDFINYEMLEKHSNFGGIRLEDNFIITEDGFKMLADDYNIPRSAQEVEEYLKSGVC